MNTAEMSALPVNAFGRRGSEPEGRLTVTSQRGMVYCLWKASTEGGNSTKCLIQGLLIYQECCMT